MSFILALFFYIEGNNSLNIRQQELPFLLNNNYLKNNKLTFAFLYYMKWNLVDTVINEKLHEESILWNKNRLGQNTNMWLNSSL